MGKGTHAGATPHVPRSAWRVSVLDAIGRLRNLLRDTSPDGPRVVEIEAKLEEAQALAQRRRGPLDWLSGGSIERAWGLVHQAEEELLLVLEPAALGAQLTRIRRLAAIQHADDGRVALLERLDPCDATVEPCVRHALRDVLVRAHLRSDAAHQAQRRLRNLILGMGFLLAILVLALWATDVADGEIVGLGALGGALAVVLTLREGQRLQGDYNLELAQALLKLPTGAATALGAVVILQATSPDLADDVLSLYALVFGFSQQAFTRLVDQKASALTQASPSVTRAPGPGVGETAPAHAS